MAARALSRISLDRAVQNRTTIELCVSGPQISCTEKDGTTAELWITGHIMILAERTRGG
jgi:hypothetical protein